ncbi:MAG: OmpH family outer membrane protein, partial [Zetaproteobacteria bacterium]
MKRAVLGALCAIAFAASASAAELRIAFVDVKAAIENTKEYQQGIAQLKAF